MTTDRINAIMIDASTDFDSVMPSVVRSEWSSSLIFGIWPMARGGSNFHAMVSLANRAEITNGDNDDRS